jgi:ATP-dependent Clp protease ATP-binding subunit ClpA
MVRFTPQAGDVPALAAEEAERLRHAYLGPEHLLLGLLRQDDTRAAGVLRAHDLDLESTRAGIGELMARGALPGPQPSDAQLLASVGIDLDAVYRHARESFGAAAYYEAAQWVRTRSGDAVPHAPKGGTPLMIRRTMLMACEQASTRSQEVTPEDLLLGLLREAEDPISTGLLPDERQLSAYLGRPLDGPHPVRLLVEARGATLEGLRTSVLHELDGDAYGRG